MSCHKSSQEQSSPRLDTVAGAAVIADTVAVDSLLPDTNLSIYTDQVLVTLQHRYRRVGADAFFGYMQKMVERGFSLTDEYMPDTTGTVRYPLDIFQFFGLQEGPQSPRYYGSFDLQANDLQGAVSEATTCRYTCDSVVDEHPYSSNQVVHTDSVEFNRNGTQTNLRQYLGLLNLQGLRRNAQGRIIQIGDNAGHVYHFTFRSDGNMQHCLSIDPSGRKTYSVFRYGKRGEQLEMDQLTLADVNYIRKVYYKVLSCDSYGNWTERLRREVVDRQHKNPAETTLYLEKRVIKYY